MTNDICKNKTNNNNINNDMSTDHNNFKMTKSRQRGANLTSHLLAKQLSLTLPLPTRRSSVRASEGAANSMARLPPCRSRGASTQPLP